MNPETIAQAIQAASSFQGINWALYARWIGISTTTWLPLGVQLQGVTTGTLGTGVVIGKFYLTPMPIAIPAMTGINAPLLGVAVGMGIGAALTAEAAYVGVSTGVGVGTDVSLVQSANAGSLVSILQSTGITLGLTGVLMPALCSQLGVGIAGLLQTGTGVGSVAGPPSPTAGAGTSLSRIV